MVVVEVLVRVVLVGLVVEAVVTGAAPDCTVGAGGSRPTGTHRTKPQVIKTSESALCAGSF